MAVLLLLPAFAFAQKVTVRGVVVDETGAPLSGAAVLVQGTSQGTVTGPDGTFSLSAEEGKVLVVSYLGYTDQTVRAAGKYLTISLEPDANYLQDVVVVGYDTQKKVNLTGSVATVSTADFGSRPIVQASTALQGMAPGVTVTTAGGAPGADAGTIQIRGIGSFGGSSSSPLILIDGVEGNLNLLDATQIDQISILKDAASSAIYGNRAANGVILVTTKRADREKFSVSYRGYAGWQKPVVYPSVANAEQYMTLSRQASENDGAVSLYTDAYIANYMMNHWLDPDAFPIVDWQKRLMTGDGFTHNHVLNLSAGSKRIRNRTSFGYLDQDGIIKSARYTRYNLRNNADIDLSDKLSMRLDLAVTYSRRLANPYQGTVFNIMNSRDPLMLAQWSDGSYAPFTGGTTNPLPMIEQNLGGSRITNRIALTGSASLTFKPFKWLTLEGKYAPRLTVVRTHSFNDVVNYHSDPYGNVSSVQSREYNSLTEEDTFTFNDLSQATAIASWKFGSHALRLLAGASYERMDYQTLEAYRQDYAYPEYEVISAGGANEFKTNSGTHTQLALGSYFGRINYNFKERYLLEANFRADGSSRFAPEHRWGYFPSVSAAWRVSEEPFMKAISNTLTELKFRASYGMLGNQNIGSSYYPTEQTLTQSSIFAGGKLHPLVALNTLANRDITWETTKMADIGLDIAFWNKLSITADVYHKLTDGILMELDIPSSIGLGAPFQNAGVVRNIGWEVSAGYRDAAGDFRWGVNANLSDVHNEILNMRGTSESSGVLRNQEGSSINSLYLLKCLGIVQTQEQADWMNENCPQYGQITHPGDLVYEDVGGATDEDGNPIPDGKIDDNDKQILGSLIPRYTFGVTLDFGWKGWNLSALIQGVGKADAFISGYYTQPCVSGGTFRAEHMDSWTPDNPDARFPRLSYVSDLNRKVSTFWMADGSYVRLKNVELSYTLPARWTRALKVGKVMLFANATNLLTFSRYYQGYDPETAYQSGAQGATTGSIGNNYPLVSTYTGGIEITF